MSLRDIFSGLYLIVLYKFEKNVLVKEYFIPLCSWKKFNEEDLVYLQVAFGMVDGLSQGEGREGVHLSPSARYYSLYRVDFLCSCTFINFESCEQYAKGLVSGPRHSKCTLTSKI